VGEPRLPFCCFLATFLRLRLPSIPVHLLSSVISILLTHLGLERLPTLSLLTAFLAIPLEVALEAHFLVVEDLGRKHHQFNRFCRHSQ
jgi:hypothetical protein